MRKFLGINPHHVRYPSTARWTSAYRKHVERFRSGSSRNILLNYVLRRIQSDIWRHSVNSEHLLSPSEELLNVGESLASRRLLARERVYKGRGRAQTSRESRWLTWSSPKFDHNFCIRVSVLGNLIINKISLIIIYECVTFHSLIP